MILHFIPNVPLIKEGCPTNAFDIAEVLKITGVSEFVNIDDMIIGIFVDEKAHYVTAYEAGSSRH